MIKAFLMGVLRRTPLFSGLSLASRENLAEAAKEFGFLWFFTTLPLFVNIFIVVIGRQQPPQNSSRLAWAIMSNLRAGEIFIYVNALLAPVLLVLYKYNRDRKHFQNHMAFMWSSYVSIVFCALILGLHKAGVIFDSFLIAAFAAAFYIIAITLRYLGLVYDSLRPSFTEEQREQEQELVDKVKDYPAQ